MKKIVIIFFCSYFLLSACSGKRLIKKTPARQNFKDITAEAFPNLPGGIIDAKLARVNRDPYADLAVLRKENGRATIKVWLNQEDDSFATAKRTGWTSKTNDNFRVLATGFLNRDGAADIVLLGSSSSGKTVVKLLLNNGKGYYYNLKGNALPPIRQGIERVDLVDIDNDGTRDLFFTGRKVLNPKGKIDEHQVQVMINNGRGEFQDATSLLMPSSPQGIVGVTFADYNGDDVNDLYLVYGRGPNRMLINNGVGRFVDETKERLPVIHDKSLHADWADFDMDGDNDLMIATKSIDERHREFSREYNYVLENTGQGYFEKRTLKVLPPYPSRRIYLLDANGSDIPDAIVLSQRGAHYLRGLGKWKFSRESKLRLPAPTLFKEMSFADVNDDSYLDILGITAKGGEVRLWMNRFNR
ncbi:MAG: FG-GAP repeat domain-containing protein [Nitrospinales bacterium]